MADLLGFCDNKVSVAEGTTCQSVADGAGMTINQLVSLNPYLGSTTCDAPLQAQQLCIAAPADRVRPFN